MADNTDKTTWGGKRPGAGLKPSPVQRVTISSRIDEKVLEQCMAEADRRRMSLSAFVAHVLKIYFK